MQLQSGNYVMRFERGGVEVLRDGAILYFNRRPMYAFIKTVLSITEFYDAPYDAIREEDGKVIAERMIGAGYIYNDAWWSASGRNRSISVSTFPVKEITAFVAANGEKIQ